MRLTFRAWMARTRKTDDAVGDFLADARRDTRVPRPVKSLAHLQWYLTRRDACEGALDAAEKAWLRYLAETAEQVHS